MGEFEVEGVEARAASGIFEEKTIILNDLHKGLQFLLIVFYKDLNYHRIVFFNHFQLL